MRWEAVKKTVLWTVFRPTVRARKREDVDFRAAEIVSPAGPTKTVNAPIGAFFMSALYVMAYMTFVWLAIVFASQVCSDRTAEKGSLIMTLPSGARPVATK